MGASLLNTQLGTEVLGLANHIFQRDIAKIMKDGPLEALSETEVTQPACLVHGYVVAFRLNQLSFKLEGLPALEGADSVCIVGNSIGELTGKHDRSSNS